jgi:photosystem II stability/assembly factor-like uncharacterized protein
MKYSTYIALLFIFAISNTCYPQGWFVQNTFSPAQSLQVIRFYDANTGWTTAPLYNSSTYNIHKTTNAGQNWTDQSSGYTSMRFMAIWISSPDTVYVSGNNGIIIKTINGGQNWFTLPTNDTVQFWGLDFVNSMTGYAAGSYGHVIKTTNGGANWSINYLAQSQNLLSSIYFLNENTGYISGSVIILKTTNAGTSWNQLGAAFQNFEGMNQIQFLNDQTGYGVTSADRFFKTTDAGTTWSISTISTNPLMAEYFVNVNTGYACGWNGTILYTTNAGSNWSTQASGLTDILTSVWFTNSLTGYISTWYGHVLKTTNGGITFAGRTGEQVPEDYRLYQNYPNPFNPVTTIKFEAPPVLPEREVTVTLKVYDILGRESAILVNEPLSPGSYEVTFDASGLPSGVYFYKLSAGNYTDTKKMVVVK